MNAVLETKDDSLEFPLLAVHLKTRMVVLFTDDTTGMCLDNGDAIDRGKGDYRRDWVNISDSNVWKILPYGSKITLIQT